MKYRLVLIITSFIILINLSCKKEEDLQHPVITIDQPAENLHFSVMDTIPVSAGITDDNNIVSIKVVLVNEKFTPVLDAYYYYPETKSYNLNIYYPIDDYYMKRGSYYIQIRAEDGTNFKNKFRKVYINEVPVNFELVVVITQKDENLLKVSGINDSLEIEPLFEINGDFASSEISSRHQHLYVAGRDKINI
ncbi:MAG: hypothetical protein K8R68_03285, partial [Bacteroidales bacterium]|nr:hypothetical protein [Bacteroidales bacterium]